jgi:hypothetical protein
VHLCGALGGLAIALFYGTRLESSLTPWWLLIIIIAIDVLLGYANRHLIDLSRRDKHGALLDANLLAEVYAELCGGRQAALSLQTVHAVRLATSNDLLRQRPEPLSPRLSAAEEEAHADFVATMKAPIWDRYITRNERTPSAAN